MPLQLPNLDDRTFEDLYAEARALIPAYAPEWTNHNLSDPGITLVELFAYLAEMLMYRLNQVTDENMLAFLRLLNGPKWSPSPGQTLNDQIRATMLQIRQPNRAVTCADFENLTLAASPQVARARCLPRRDLDALDSAAIHTDKAGHISVVVVPNDPVSLQPSAELIQTIRAFLEPRRLLTTWVHVVGPHYLAATIQLTLMLKPDALADTVTVQATRALGQFLDPLTGGPQGKGWPFGRDIFVSEIYELLDRQPGVDYVLKSVDPQTQQPLDELAVRAEDAGRLERNARGELFALQLRPDELVDAQNMTYKFIFLSPLKF